MLRIVLMAAAVAFGMAAAAAPDAMFRGGADHAGSYPAADALLGKLKWRFETRGPVVSTPAVAGGIVYVGSFDHFIYAIDAATGRQVWKFATKGRVASSPAVVDGVLYVESYDGNMYALDAKTGALRWTFATEGERRFAATHLHGAEPRSETMPDVFDFFLSAPAVVDHVVYFGSGDHMVYALDVATGRPKWRFRTGDVVHASPAVVAGTVFIGSWDSRFYAIDAATGAEKWHFEAGHDAVMHNQVGFQSSAAVVDGVVYVGCRDSKLYALDARSGAERWAFDNKGSWVVGSPAVRDGKVYFATSDTGLFHVLDSRSGAAVFSLDFRGWPMFSSPAVAGRLVFIGTHQGQLVAIDTAKRQVVWRFDTIGAQRNGRSFTRPDGRPDNEAAYGDSFYDAIVIGTYRIMSVGAVLSSPVIDGGAVYFGSFDGNVYAVI